MSLSAKKFGAFIRRNEKKLLLLPVLILPVAIVIVFLIPKPKPIELPHIPHDSKPDSAHAAGSVAAPVFKEILQTYQGLEQKVMTGVGMPEADREAFYKAREQVMQCSENADAGGTTLEDCVTQHIAWLVNDVKADIDQLAASAE